MIELRMKADSIPVRYKECPPGFFLCHGQLCFKSEYNNDNGSPIGYNSAGEFFCRELTRVVIPMVYGWFDTETEDELTDEEAADRMGIEDFA